MPQRAKSAATISPVVMSPVCGDVAPVGDGDASAPQPSDESANAHPDDEEEHDIGDGPTLIPGISRTWMLNSAVGGPGARVSVAGGRPRRDGGGCRRSSGGSVAKLTSGTARSASVGLEEADRGIRTGWQ